MYNINDYVKIKDINKNGYIVSKSKKNCIVNLDNNMNILVDYSNIELVNNDKNLNSRIKTNVKITFNKTEKDFSFKPEIMLRHQTVEEAIYNLEIFLYQALNNHCTQVKIIHGRSGGILRKNVHLYLDKCDFIKEYRLGNYFEGSYGVTIVYLSNK